MKKLIPYFAFMILAGHSCILGEQLSFDFCTFTNNSNDTLVIYTNTHYPDTILPPYNNTSEDFCPPHHTITIGTVNRRETMFKKNSVIQAFVYKWSDILAFRKKQPAVVDSLFNIGPYHLELRRYELTREWLDEHDWTVVYP